MVNENYGPIFTQKRRADRQRSLKDRYWFDCRCLPCTEDWPLIGEMTDDTLRFRCRDPVCRKPLVVAADTMTPFIACPSCKKSNNILKVMPKYARLIASVCTRTLQVAQPEYNVALSVGKTGPVEQRRTLKLDVKFENTTKQ